MEEAQVSSYNHCYHHSECVCVSVYVSSCRLLGIGVSWIFMMEPLVETAAWETRAPPPHTHTLMATAAGRESVCLSASGWDTQQQRRFVANVLRSAGCHRTLTGTMTNTRHAPFGQTGSRSPSAVPVTSTGQRCGEQFHTTTPSLANASCGSAPWSGLYSRCVVLCKRWLVFCWLNETCIKLKQMFKLSYVACMTETPQHLARPMEDNFK